jgi:two-component system, sensor histidine kinase YesM
MKLTKKIVENKFFLKVLLTYCIIIIVSLGFTAYFIMSSMLNNLFETESKYEQEVIQKVKTYSDDKFKAINGIFNFLYTDNYYSPNGNTSITDLLNPNKNIEISTVKKRNYIQTSMQNICNGNNFITDMIILDYGKKDVFFYSNEPYRDLSINSDFFNSSTYKRIKEGRNTREIIPNYIPDYITNSSNSKTHPVLTVFINLYDTNYIKDDKKIGAIAININPDVFSNAYKDENNNIKGDVMVMNNSGLVFFDSRKVLTGQYSPYREFINSEGSLTLKQSDLIINYLKSESSDLIFMNVVKKGALFKDIQKIQNRAINIIIFCIFITVLISIFASEIFTKRLKNLVNHMRIIEKGNFDDRIEIKSNDEIGYIERNFNSMSQKIKEYILTEYLIEIRTKTAELKSLQAQINPHFMFNTLESIRITALMNKDIQAAKMIHILGDMFRWNIKMREIIVDISDEVEYINSYIELQKYRYEGFEADILIEKDILTLGIPKLVLQPIVENAIYHGMSSNSKEGRLLITGKLCDEVLEIAIIDNGEGMKTNKINEIMKTLQEDSDDYDLYSIGLRNVHQRLRILFGEPYGLSVFSKEGNGTTVTIMLPAQSKQEMMKNV